MPRPVLPPRPDLYMEGVVRMEARCDPADVIANRLDPWHGAHYHPYSFAELQVIDRGRRRAEGADRQTARRSHLRRDRLHIPQPGTSHHRHDHRRGRGKGSVVETHATPIEPGRTAIVEATLATSDRKGFRHARKLQRLIRPFIERSARRLWVDDAAYAERLYELRNGSPS